MPKFDKRYWWSPDGTRSIDLAAVVEVEIMRVGCSYRLSGDAAHPLWLDGKAGSDSFLTALRAWREEKERKRA